MAKTNEYLGEAYETLQRLSADDQKRLEYEARQKAILDYNSNILGAEQRGERRGKALGIELARNVFKLYMQGKSEEEIAEICTISVDSVKEIIE